MEWNAAVRSYPYDHSCMYRLIFQRLKVDNRIQTIVGFLMSIFACLIMTDWQAIPHDPCTELSPFHTHKEFQELKERLPSPQIDLNHELWQSNDSFLIAHAQVIKVLKGEQYIRSMRSCENANISSGDQCYWIPNSIVTKKLCEDCQPICRSPQRSLTFAQYCIGAALLTMAFTITYPPIFALLSDRLQRGAQVHCQLLQVIFLLLNSNPLL